MKLKPRIEYSEQPLESPVCEVCDHNDATLRVTLTIFPQESEGVECAAGFESDILACAGCAEILQANATPLEEV